MQDKCKDCKFFHNLKIFPRIPIKVPGGWGVRKSFRGFENASCCIAFTRVGTNEECNEYDSFVIEVEGEDMCEMFTPKEK